MVTLSRIIFMYLLASIFSACSAAAAPPTPVTSGATEAGNSTGALGIFPHPYVGRFEELDLEEPSGIIFHSGRGALFVIGDKGHLTELEIGGARLKQERLDEKDGVWTFQ